MPTTVEGALASDRPGMRGGALGLARRAARAALPRFLAVGTAGLACDAAAFGLGHALGALDWIARAISLAVATLVTWQLNRRFTFAASGRRVRSEAARYGLVTCLAQGFNYALFLALRTSQPGLGALPTLVLAAGCAALLSFCGQRFFTFRPISSPA